MEEVDPTIVETTRELIEKGYEEETEEKLKKMGYTDSQVKEIFRKARIRKTEREERLKKWKFIALAASIIIFIFGMTLIAILQTI